MSDVGSAADWLVTLSVGNFHCWQHGWGKISLVSVEGDLVFGSVLFGAFYRLDTD